MEFSWIYYLSYYNQRGRRPRSLVQCTSLWNPLESTTSLVTTGEPEEPETYLNIPNTTFSRRTRSGAGTIAADVSLTTTRGKTPRKTPEIGSATGRRMPSISRSDRQAAIITPQTQNKHSQHTNLTPIPTPRKPNPFPDDITTSTSTSPAIPIPHKHRECTCKLQAQKSEY